jgi:hypothetical protein
MGEKGNLADRAEDVAQNLIEQAPALWLESRGSGGGDAGGVVRRGEADVPGGTPHSAGARPAGQDAGRAGE